VLVVQFRLRRYVPAVYWLTVVLISVVGTLLTDQLTDGLGVELGTAAGDWSIDLTGWSPGPIVLVPAALILIVLAAWKRGAGPVLTLWLAYIRTRPLGANLGDFLALDHSEGGLGLGTFGTTALFLAAIVAVVAYLTKTRKDQTEIAYADRT
jgi:uncharacterized membrane-anchored protein